MLTFHSLQPLREIPGNASRHFICHITEFHAQRSNDEYYNTVYPLRKTEKLATIIPKR
jgi:hypothetical protein